MKNKLGLVSFASIVVILITFGLLAIPGQYIGLSKVHTQGTTLAGYEYIFHVIRDIGSTANPYFSSGRPSVTGIIAIVFIALAAASFVFYKKSTALPLLGGILELVAGFFFLMTTPFSHLIYKQRSDLSAGFVPYVVGSLLVVLGIAAIVFSILELRKEKVVLETKGGYSYLKK